MVVELDCALHDVRQPRDLWVQRVDQLLHVLELVKPHVLPAQWYACLDAPDADVVRQWLDASAAADDGTLACALAGGAASTALSVDAAAVARRVLALWSLPAEAAAEPAAETTALVAAGASGTAAGDGTLSRCVCQ